MASLLIKIDSLKHFPHYDKAPLALHDSPPHTTFPRQHPYVPHAGHPVALNNALFHHRPKQLFLTFPRTRIPLAATQGNGQEEAHGATGERGPLPDSARRKGEGQFGADGGDGLLEAGVRGNGREGGAGRVQREAENRVEWLRKGEIKVTCLSLGRWGASGEQDEKGDDEDYRNGTAEHAQM